MARYSYNPAGFSNRRALQHKHAPTANKPSGKLVELCFGRDGRTVTMPGDWKPIHCFERDGGQALYVARQRISLDIDSSGEDLVC